MERLGARASNTVHPRMRGERPLTFSHVSDLSGSSPHARGTPILLNTPILNRRFIPACAGNALINPFQGRGETGSSPHARGTHRRGGQDVCRGRFIPACAGNADFLQAVYGKVSVHPRMRGERQDGGGQCITVYGSSPHARGTLIALPAQRQLGRFIPACAGNAYIPHWNLPYDSVHPRMRGERSRHTSLDLQYNGSSPHARGTHGSSVARS